MSDEKLFRLKEVFAKYKRWLSDGSKPYGYALHQQLYYDLYHEHITRLTNNKEEYGFSIQVFDSPEMDTWWEGEFSVVDGDIVLTKDDYRHV